MPVWTAVEACATSLAATGSVVVEPTVATFSAVPRRDGSGGDDRDRRRGAEVERRGRARDDRGPPQLQPSPAAETEDGARRQRVDDGDRDGPRGPALATSSV